MQGLSEAELRLAMAEQIASLAFNGDFDSLPEVDLSAQMSRDLFRGDDTDASTARVVAIVGSTWPLAAAQRFPGRTFHVRVLPAGEDCGPMLTLIEDRP